MVLNRDPLLVNHACGYVDDVILFAETLPKLLEVLEALFTAFRDTGLPSNSSKCLLLPKTVVWCGYTMGAGGVTVNTQKLIEMLDLQVPRNKKELKKLLGSCAYFRVFLPQYCHNAGVLQELL